MQVVRGSTNIDLSRAGEEDGATADRSNAPIGNYQKLRELSVNVISQFTICVNVISCFTIYVNVISRFTICVNVISRFTICVNVISRFMNCVNVISRFTICVKREVCEYVTIFVISSD